MADIQNIEVRQINIIEEADLYAQAVELRNEQLRKKIGLSIYDEDLSAEKDYVILAALASAEDASESDPKTVVVGCVVLRPEEDGKTFRLKQMAVHPSYQGQNIGRHIIEAVEKVTRANLRSRIFLHARIVSKGFYEKLGYSVISEEFIEVNIPHCQMEKVL